MPAQGQRIVRELRAGGFAFRYPAPYVFLEGLWRPAFAVEPASRLNPSQRADLRTYRSSVCPSRSSWRPSGPGSGVAPRGPTPTACSSGGRLSAARSRPSPLSGFERSRVNYQIFTIPFVALQVVPQVISLS
jgi:hypothetical protein